MIWAPIQWNNYNPDLVKTGGQLNGETSPLILWTAEFELQTFGVSDDLSTTCGLFL